MIHWLSDPTFWTALLQIVAIDILLGGDNAVVIALACRHLPAHRRKQAIFGGVAGAILIRILLLFFALHLLDLPYLKVIGALLLLWIGIKLLLPEEENGDDIKGSTHLLGAIKTIIIARGGELRLRVEQVEHAEVGLQAAGEALITVGGNALRLGLLLQAGEAGREARGVGLRQGQGG